MNKVMCTPEHFYREIDGIIWRSKRSENRWHQVDSIPENAKIWTRYQI